MNTYSNINKAIQLGNDFWEETDQHGLLNIAVENSGNGYVKNESGHKFINMCSYSYLGLDTNQNIIQAAVNAILEAGTLNSPSSRVRIHLKILKEAEDSLSDLFQAEAITATTCSAVASGILPLIAAGVFTDDIAPTMVFDKHAHFCLSLMKPICGDETMVMTAPHNDMDYLEEICKKNKKVAYIADGVYSTGGHAPIKELLELQNKYGLFLFFDEAHSISAYGRNGRGLVLEQMGQLNKDTIIVASLNKGFGASGGLLLLESKNKRPIVNRFGGPFSWSQRINTAGLGAIIASAKLHKTNQINTLQDKLKNNINHFDRLIKTENAGDELPIRLIPLSEEHTAVRYSKKIFDRGFYTSPLFFPIVPRGRAGLRIMIRADLSTMDINQFCTVVSDVTNNS